MAAWGHALESLHDPSEFVDSLESRSPVPSTGIFTFFWFCQLAQP
jgi:hypothetical protein